MRAHWIFVCIFFSSNLLGGIKDLMRPIYFGECVKSICGEQWDSYKLHFGYPPQKEAVTEESERQWHQQKAKLAQEIQTHFDKLMKVEADNFLSSIPETVPTNEDFIALRSEEKVVVLLLVASQKFNSFIEFNSNEGSFSLNIDKIKKMRSHLNEPVLADIMETFLYKILSMIQKDMEFEKTYHKEKFHSFVEQLSTRKKQVDLALQTLPESEQDLVTSINTEKVFDVKTKSDLKEQFSQILYIEINILLLQDKKLRENIDRVNLFQFSDFIFEIPQLVDYIKEITKNRQEQYRAFLEEKKIEKIEKRMDLTLTRSLTFLPTTAYEQRELESRSTKGFYSALSRIKNLFPHEPELHKYLDTIEIHLPPTQDEYAKELILLIQNEIRSFQQEKTTPQFKKISFLLKLLHSVQSTDIPLWFEISRLNETAFQ